MFSGRAYTVLTVTISTRKHADGEKAQRSQPDESCRVWQEAMWPVPGLRDDWTGGCRLPCAY
jgi:hypothetical protein